MGKTKEAAALSSIQDQFKSLKKEIADLKKSNNEKDKHIRELKKQKKEDDKKSKAQEKEIKDLVKRETEQKKKVEKLENQKTSERTKDISTILSENARVAIKSSTGPLTPEELQTFLINDLLGKRHIDPETVFKKYSEYDIYEVKHQMLCIHNIVKAHMIHREEQMKLDDKLIKTFEKLQIVQQNKSKCNRKRSSNQNFDNDDSENWEKRRRLADDDDSEESS